MRCSRLAMLAAVSLVIAGCGSVAPSRDALPTTDSPVLATSNATAVPDTIAETVPPLPPTTDAGSPDTSAVAALTVAPEDVAENTAPITEGALGGVTIDDIVPEQNSADLDAAVAEEGVRFAYQHWILLGLPADVLGRIVENGEANAVEMAANIDKARGLIEFARVEVDDVQFLTSATAAVTFHLTWHDSPSPIFPDPIPGEAIYQRGTWRLTTATLCKLALAAGENCGKVDPSTPPIPTSLILDPIPTGLVRLQNDVDIEPERGLPVPGAASWEGGGRTLTASAIVSPQLSRLGDSDLRFVLSSRAGGDGSTTTLDGRPAWIAEYGGRTVFVVVRADNILLTLEATGFSSSELTAIARTFAAPLE